MVGEEKLQICIKTLCPGATEMAQSARYSPCKYRNLSFDPWQSDKSPRWWPISASPALGEEGLADP